MKQNSKQRLFEVMARLDKTFKPKQNISENIMNEVSDSYEEIMNSFPGYCKI